jgi:hypothetical protein
MPIYTQANEATRYIEEMPLGTGEAVSATIAETLRFSPTAALFRGGEQLYSDYVEQSPLIDAKTARQRVEQEGLKLTIPDDGIKENVLNILIERKYEENRLKGIIERGPDGFAAGLATFGASLGASLLDPINVASAFVPIYGQARYTSLLANATGAIGRAGVRARVGAVEGLAGVSLVEPIVYATARYEQADYDMTDSLEALAFGTIFGGGLHMGVGALADAFKRTGSTLTAKPDGNVGRILNSLEPETRTDVFRGAMGQVLSGRQIDIEARLQMDPIFRNITARALESTSLTPMTRFEPPPITGLSTPEVALNAAVNPTLVEPPLRVTTGAMDNLGDIPVYATAREAERIRDKVLNNRGESLEIKQLPDGTYTLLRPYDAQPVRNADGTPMSFDTERAAIKASKAITDLQDRNLTPVAFMEAGQMKFALVENAPKGMAAAAKKNPELVDLGLAMDRSINAESKLIDEDIARNKVQKAYERMRESYRAENLRLADMEAVRSVDDTYAVAMRPEKPDMPVDDLDAIVEETRRVSDALGLRAEFDAELAKYDALIQDADSVGRAFEAAALCGLRRG